MKNKLKHLFKLGILIFGISLFIVSCQKNDDINISDKEINGEKSPFKFSEIDESQINQNKNLGRKLKSITNNIKQSKLANANKQIYSTEDDFYIDTNYATYIENTETNYHSYTFPVFRTTQTNNIENVLLSLQVDGSYKAMLIDYNLNSQEILDLDNELHVDLTNKFTIYSLEDDVFVNNIFNKTLAPGDCVGILTCPYEGDHPATQKCIKENRGDLFIDPSMCDDSGSGITTTNGNTSNNPSGYDTSSGHETGGTSNNSGNYTSITKPQPWQDVVMCINGALSQSDEQTDNTTLTPEMQTWLQSQPKSVAGPINNILQDDNCSEEAQAFGIFAIQALMEDFHNSTINDIIAVLTFEQDYRTEMSTSEIVIFDSLDRNKQLKYLQSAYNAKVMSEDLYPNSSTTPCNLYNGIGDAYRHSLWNALSTVRIGETLTEQLTTAHEERPAPIGYTNYYLENQMDFHNNAQGRLIAYGSGLVWEMVKTSLENGDLRYLTNLDSSNTLSRCRATNSSILTPTH